MGSYFDGQCDTGPEQAQVRAYSRVVPTITDAGLVSVQQVNGVWQVVTDPVGGGSVIMHTASSMSFPDCDITSAVYEGQLLGWATAAIWAVAWGFTIIKRMLR